MQTMIDTDSFSATAHEVVDLIVGEKLRLGLSTKAPIRIAFATETRNGRLPNSIQLYGEDILESLCAVTSPWDARAHLFRCQIAGEELVVSFRPD